MNRTETLTRRVSAGHITRREFTSRAVAFGLAVPAALSLTDSAQAATPKKGGRFRIATVGASSGDSLDPALVLGYMVQVSFGQLRNCLTEVAPDGSLIGELAESWEASSDAATWTFKIREGVEFHNGKTLDSDDVVASLNHHRGEKSKSAAKSVIAPIEDIRADGKDRIVVALTGGNADFPYLMSDYHLSICPAKPDGGIDWKSGIGTGAFVLESFEPGIKTVTRRNPNYWKEGHGHFDVVETLFIADVVTRTNALTTGDVDVISNVDLKTVHLLERSPGVVIISTTGNPHVTFPMHATAAPFDDNNVRLALKHAIDREKLLQHIMKGYGEVGNDYPIGPANRYRATLDEIPQRQYDPERARFHLKKAGRDRLSVKLHVANSAFNGAVDAALLYSETAKPAGISIEVVREPDDGYWSNVWLKKSWSASSWGGRPTEDWMFSQAYAAGADWNESKWDHAEFNELLIAARSELDEDKRRDQYVEMQRILNEEGSTIIPLFTPYVQAASDKLRLPEVLGTNWELDGHKCAERWSFA